MPRWFRKKTFGYGWTAASWEGWLATLLLILACVGVNDPELMRLDKTARMICTLALVAGFFALVLATSGRESETKDDF